MHCRERGRTQGHQEERGRGKWGSLKGRGEGERDGSWPAGEGKDQDLGIPRGGKQGLLGEPRGKRGTRSGDTGKRVRGGTGKTSWAEGQRLGGLDRKKGAIRGTGAASERNVGGKGQGLGVLWSSVGQRWNQRT